MRVSTCPPPAPTPTSGAWDNHGANGDASVRQQTLLKGQTHQRVPLVNSRKPLSPDLCADPRAVNWASCRFASSTLHVYAYHSVREAYLYQVPVFGSQRGGVFRVYTYYLSWNVGGGAIRPGTTVVDKNILKRSLTGDSLTFALMAALLRTPFFFQIVRKRRSGVHPFWHTCLYICSAYIVKVSDPGHSRSGHQVTPSDLTS